MPEILKSVHKGVAAAAVMLMAICLILSILQLFADISDGILSFISVAVLGTVSYTAAYISTQLCRTKGLLQGVLCGTSVFSVALLASVLTHEFSFTDMTAVKAVVCLIAGIAGGIKGVNTKKTNLRRIWH